MKQKAESISGYSVLKCHFMTSLKYKSMHAHTINLNSQSPSVFSLSFTHIEV